MGIIKAVKQAIGGGFADTWQEVIEPDNIGDQTVYARGVLAALSERYDVAAAIFEEARNRGIGEAGEALRQVVELTNEPK